MRYRAAQGGDIVVVLFEGGRKTVVAVSIADEVEEAGLCRVHCRFERASAGIGDRSWRQAGVTVRVVGRVELHVIVMQGAAVSSPKQLGINYAGIGLQRNSAVQARPVSRTASKS